MAELLVGEEVAAAEVGVGVLPWEEVEGEGLHLYLLLLLSLGKDTIIHRIIAIVLTEKKKAL